MSKQVYIAGDWYDIVYMPEQEKTDDLYVVCQYRGRPHPLTVSPSTIRDKPKEEEVEVESVDWTKPLQIKCGGGRHWEQVWADVVFYKRYGDVIALIFEKDGESVYITENAKDFNLTVRNRPPIIKFEKWIIYSKDGLVHTCGTEFEAQKRLLHFKNGGHFIKHIKVEWEL